VQAAFQAEMKAEKSLYAGWDLREIALMVDHPLRQDIWYVMQVLTKCIPSIQILQWSRPDYQL
jgi:hypothetical protein